MDINSQDAEGELPLHLAVKVGDVPTTTILLSCGANVNALNGLSCNHKCCPLPCVKEHPLVLAAQLGFLPLVKLLLDRGASPNAQTQFYNRDAFPLTKFTGKSALHYSAEEANVQMLEALIQAGARTDMRDQFGNTVFHAAVHCYSRWHKEQRNEHDWQPWLASQERCQKQQEILSLLCSSFTHSPAVNEINNARISALFVAALHGCNCKVQILLNAGADPNIEMGSYGSPLHAAVYHDYLDVALTLIQYGSKLNVTNFHGHTPLTASLCLYGSKTDLITTLIVHGADLQVPDQNSQNTLIEICITKDREDCNKICTLLVYAGCKLNRGTWQRLFNIIPDKEENLRGMLRDMCCTPHTLKDITRICIRGLLKGSVVKNGQSIVQTIMKLPLPRSITEYLLLKDIVDNDMDQ